MKARPRRPGRPRRPWTAARTTKMLRQCPLAIAVSTAVRNSHKRSKSGGEVELHVLGCRLTY